MVQIKYLFNAHFGWGSDNITLFLFRIVELFVPKMRVKMLEIEQFGIKYNRVDPKKLEG